MKTIKIIAFYSLVYCIVAITGCKSTPEKIQNRNDQEDAIVTSALTDKGSYNVNGQVKLTCSFTNKKESAVAIKNIVVQVKNISNASSPVVYEKKIDTTISLNTKQKYTLDNVDLWKIPADAATNAYGIYLQYELDKSAQQANYMSFFRIVKDTDFTTYRIDHSTYKELDVYALHGGMSA